MEIRLKNEDGNIIELLNFENLSSTGSDNIIEAELRIYLGEIIINSQISLMFSVLKNFYNDLKKSYEKMKGDASIVDLDSRISIVFECEKSGYVYIKGIVKNQAFSGKVEFDFSVDQSYLQDVVNKTKEIIAFL